MNAEGDPQLFLDSRTVKRLNPLVCCDIKWMVEDGVVMEDKCEEGADISMSGLKNLTKLIKDLWM